MKQLLGGILLAIGLLIAGASGLCTGVMLVMSIGQSGSAGIIPLALLFGGVPFGIGLLLFFGGRALLRSAREEEGD